MNSILDLDDKLYYQGTAWYIWHTTDKAWILGWDSFLNLKKAFKELALLNQDRGGVGITHPQLL